MALYSEIVMDHFMHPRNVGCIEDANGIGEIGNAKCGDIMKIYLKIENNIIVDVKFETFGCGSAIASSITPTFRGFIKWSMTASLYSAIIFSLLTEYILSCRSADHAKPGSCSEAG